MRNIKFKKFIKTEYTGEAGSKRAVKGTGCWEDDFTHEGLFHQWGVCYDEFEEGAGNYSVAIVELENGEIEEVLPSKIKFIDKLEV